MNINLKLKEEFLRILKAHKNDLNPPNHVKTIKEILELEGISFDGDKKESSKNLSIEG